MGAAPDRFAWLPAVLTAALAIAVRFAGPASALLACRYRGRTVQPAS